MHHRFRPWVDVPIDILSSIAERLGLIDLLSFRGTCKDFRSASSTASAEIESRRFPWLLIPEIDSSRCIICTKENKCIYRTYYLNIPELKGAIFVASYQGWLLLINKHSIFFFCLFSKAKIDLPKFPYKRINILNGHGVFTDVPTSPRCTVSIMTPCEVMVISKGQNNWTRHKIPRNIRLLNRIETATYEYMDQTVYFFDDTILKIISFSVKDIIMDQTPTFNNTYRLNYYQYSRPLYSFMKYKRSDNSSDIKDDEYVDVCGLTYHDVVEPIWYVYPNEIECHRGPLFGRLTRKRNAVFIQPRFFEAIRTSIGDR